MLYELIILVNLVYTALSQNGKLNIKFSFCYT